MRVLVIGHTGQDGHFLLELLKGKNIEALGISSGSVTLNSYGIKHINIVDFNEVKGLLTVYKPDHLYFLAAAHQSSSDKLIQDGELFQRSVDVNVKALVNFLEVMRVDLPNSKLFYAASSHVFGNPKDFPQNELTPIEPDCIYGITKAAGVRACRFYREKYGLFVSVGYFYNHESPIRASKYVSQKIVKGAVAIKNKKQSEIVLGDLNAKIDWGYAPDYVMAAFMTMQLPMAKEYVVASGEQHSIREFVEAVFMYLNLDWSKYIQIDETIITKRQKINLVGDAREISKATGWKPSVGFKELIKILVEAELESNAK